MKMTLATIPESEKMRVLREEFLKLDWENEGDLYRAEWYGLKIEVYFSYAWQKWKWRVEGKGEIVPCTYLRKGHMVFDLRCEVFNDLLWYLVGKYTPPHWRDYNYDFWNCNGYSIDRYWEDKGVMLVTDGWDDVMSYSHDLNENPSWLVNLS